MRLIDADGAQLGIISRDDALQKADEADLDLVVVSPAGADGVPVCRLMDYSKHRYLEQKKQRESRQRSKLQETKIVQFRPKIAEHDYDFKRNNVRKFLAHGDRVQATIFFRGREQAHPEIGERILLRLIEEIADIGRPVAGQVPKREGRTITLLLEPGVAKKERPVTTPESAPEAPPEQPAA